VWSTISTVTTVTITTLATTITNENERRGSCPPPLRSQPFLPAPERYGYKIFALVRSAGTEKNGPELAKEERSLK
jgi:hypothetical protein